MSTDEPTTYDEARDLFEQMMEDVAGDRPELESDDYAADIVEACCLCIKDAEVAFELCRTELGWVPSGLKRLRPDIAAVERRRPIFI